MLGQFFDIVEVAGMLRLEYLVLLPLVLQLLLLELDLFGPELGVLILDVDPIMHGLHDAIEDF